MAEEVSDVVEAEVLQLLRKVDLDVLQGFCDELKITIPETKQGNKSLILKLIVRYLHSEHMEGLDDQGLSVFLKLQSDLKDSLAGKSLGEQKTDIDKTGIIVDDKVSGEQNQDEKGKHFVQIHRFREFKISGSIGGVEQKDTLSYSGLSFQMKQGKEAGYSYREIQAAVIKAIKPGNNLRNYLESRVKISESAFLQVLRSHFQEKDSTLVFHDLSTAVQLSSESELDFCLRVMSLRERVVTLSSEEGCPFEVS